MPELPARPSSEFLRKRAKRLARERDVALAVAQRALAADYGFRTWADLMRRVAERRDASVAAGSPLYAAVRAGDVAGAARLLAEGANPHVGNRRETPLHAAARRGPLPLVETLIAGGALEWQPDATGRTPLDVARRNRPRDRAAIVRLLDRGSIADGSFCVAVDAIHAGDVATLARAIDAEPRLLRERTVGPAAYRAARRHQYFLEPKLFWFVANNPIRVERVPENIVEVAETMIARGVDAADLDYALELTMTGSAARERGLQVPLMRALLDAGARPKRAAIVATAAHKECDALRAIVALGFEPDADVSAALGSNDVLRRLLPTLDRGDVQNAFGIAVINGNVEGARLALDAGADVGAPLVVHAHATALHQAAGDDDVSLIELLLARGAPADVRDTIWNATPLEWAIHLKRTAAERVLRVRIEDEGRSET